MSYSVAEPPPRQRPTAVSAAITLLYVYAGIQLLGLVASIATIGPMSNAFNDLLTNQPEARAVRSVALIGVTVVIIISLALMVAVVVLAVQVGKGSNTARIVTWVLGGIVLLCSGCSLLGSAFSQSLTSSLGASDPTTVDLQRKLEDAIPGWLNTVSAVQSILLLVVLAAVMVLLAMPSANEFFRKEAMVQIPPGWPATGPQPYGYPPPPPPPGETPGGIPPQL